LCSTKSLKAPDGIDAVMVTKTRALVDAVYDWSRYNTLPRAYGWIAETLKKDPPIVENLIGDTLQYGNKGTVKRIGYLLAQLGITDDRLLEMKRQLGSTRSLIPWIPGQAAKGSVNKEWGLIVNGSISGEKVGDKVGERSVFANRTALSFLKACRKQATAD